MKKCNKCNRYKKRNLFHKYGRSKDGLQAICISCRKKYDSARIRKKRTTESRRNSNYKSTYGIAISDYDKMLVSQKGGCAICGTTKNTGGKKYLEIDHNHSTGKVRGLLCSPCNIGLAVVERLMPHIDNLMDYIQKDI